MIVAEERFGQIPNETHDCAIKSERPDGVPTYRSDVKTWGLYCRCDRECDTSKDCDYETACDTCPIEGKETVVCVHKDRIATVVNESSSFPLPEEGSESRRNRYSAARGYEVSVGVRIVVIACRCVLREEVYYRPVRVCYCSVVDKTL